MSRKVYITLRGKLKAKIADGTKGADLSVVVQDNTGIASIEDVDQESVGHKLGKKGNISCDTKINLVMVVEEGTSIAKIVKRLSFFAEDSNPKSKRVQHGFSLIDGFDFKVTGWEITDSK